MIHLTENLVRDQEAKKKRGILVDEMEKMWGSGLRDPFICMLVQPFVALGTLPASVSHHAVPPVHGG